MITKKKKPEVIHLRGIGGFGHSGTAGAGGRKGKEESMNNNLIKM